MSSKEAKNFSPKRLSALVKAIRDARALNYPRMGHITLKEPVHLRYGREVHKGYSPKGKHFGRRTSEGVEHLYKDKVFVSRKGQKGYGRDLTPEEQKLVRGLFKGAAKKERDMPFASKDQHAKFRAMLERGEISQKTFDKWMAETKRKHGKEHPIKPLPEKVSVEAGTVGGAALGGVGGATLGRHLAKHKPVTMTDLLVRMRHPVEMRKIPTVLRRFAIASHLALQPKARKGLMALGTLGGGGLGAATGALLASQLLKKEAFDLRTFVETVQEKASDLRSIGARPGSFENIIRPPREVGSVVKNLGELPVGRRKGVRFTVPLNKVTKQTPAKKLERTPSTTKT